jgi:hypothetical protein
LSSFSNESFEEIAWARRRDQTRTNSTLHHLPSRPCRSADQQKAKEIDQIAQACRRGSEPQVVECTLEVSQHFPISEQCRHDKQSSRRPDRQMRDVSATGICRIICTGRRQSRSGSPLRRLLRSRMHGVKIPLVMSLQTADCVEGASKSLPASEFAPSGAVHESLHALVGDHVMTLYYRVIFGPWKGI